MTAAQFNATGSFILVVDPTDEYEVKMMTKAEFDLI